MHKLSNFKSQLKTKLKLANREKDQFSKKYDWLNGTFIENPITSRPDRLYKSFEESSERSKRRNTENLRKHEIAGKFNYAEQMSLRVSGKVDVSNVRKDITNFPR